MCSRADYKLEIFGSTFDTTDGRCFTQDGDYCDGPRDSPDVYIIFCLHPGSEFRQICSLGRIATPARVSFAGVFNFTEFPGGFLGLPNPLSFEVSGSFLPVRI